MRYDAVRPVLVLAAWSIREALRRRVFVIVALLTLGFLGLFALGCHQAFSAVGRFVDNEGIRLDGREFAGATLNGLAMFATLFLACVLAAFLTMSTVRGDAESSLLQPLVVRPVGRSQVLLARWLAAAVVCTTYVVIVNALSLAILRATGGWSPDHIVGAAFRLAFAVSVLAALCIVGSVILTSIANGIATFMLLGSGLFAGLLRQVGHSINNHGLERAGHVASLVLPYEALYQDALARTTENQVGLTRFIVRLGPLGGGDPATRWLLVFGLGYLVVVAAIAIWATNRRDL